MKRLFIAINLPESAKESISKDIKAIKPVENARFAGPENWHLTLVFLGYQPDEALGPIMESLKQTAGNFPAPSVKFDQIIYAPPDRPRRMIWLAGTQQTSKVLGEIKTDLEKKLEGNGVKFRKENRFYNAHLTLARFPTVPKSFSLPDLPGFNPIEFSPESVDLMESHLKRTGAEYEILSVFKFK